MLAKKTITNGEWKKISLAGQNGKAWIWDTGDGIAKILIAHTDTVQTGVTPIGDNIPILDALDLSIDIGYVLDQSGNPKNSEILNADNGNDIYYATLIDEGEDAKIITDFI